MVRPFDTRCCTSCCTAKAIHGPRSEACGGVVACNGVCALEAGLYGSPPASARELQPRDVDTRVDVLAPLPAEVADSGAAAVLITITNPRTEPVWVRLTP